MRTMLFVISSLLLFSACQYEKGDVPKPDPTCVTDPINHIVPVTIQDDYFSPASIEIIAGDTVKWTYSASGASAHTTTCDDTNRTLPTGGTSWDSGSSTPLLPGDTYKKRSLFQEPILIFA